MVVATSFAAGLVAIAWPALVRAAAETTLNITAFTNEVKSDWTAVYYSSSPDKNPLLIANDGGAATGGLQVYGFDAKTPLPSVKSLPVGRTKTLAVLNDVGGKDLVVSIAATDSTLRIFELPDMKQAKGDFTLLGDWSAMCAWKSKTQNQYLYIFGKRKGVQLLIRPKGKGFQVLEIQTMEVPFEASGCAVSESKALMFLHGDDTTRVHAFALKESTAQPDLKLAGETQHDVTGIAVYNSAGKEKDLLFTAQADVITIYEASKDFGTSLRGTIKLSGAEGIEASGLSILQAPTQGFKQGALAFGVETKKFEGYGIVSLDGVFDDLYIQPNTEYRPGSRPGHADKSTICKACNNSGYCRDDMGKKGEKKQRCECFAGFAGRTCDTPTCTDNCSNNGYCIGPGTCKCNDGWGGLHCSFLLVEPAYETEANGGDGDDPAIWIAKDHPEELSRVITTVKSARGAGLGVYDLQGKLVQHMEAPQPNNVDMIYGFDLGNRKADLAFAACRKDNTLCMFEMLSNGTLATIAGGSQPTPKGYKVYGSCVYRSRKTGKQYLFVNEKSARYLQYELTAEDGRLKTTLVREFKGGDGGQVEGCVADDENGWLFLGEEPSALWRYDAEPDSRVEDRVLVAKVGDGKLHGDVEGVTLVNGRTPQEGFVIVSCQGVSAYNVYRRESPHEYIMSFTITDSKDGKIDRVTNTDGITAVGRRLGSDFEHGLLVVHDDANQLPDGTTSDDASFKIVSLGSVLGAEGVKELGLLKEVDPEWDPRK